ncbi:hypothetical protein FHL15_008714 [Xylaria flabelliformis]|uniref:Uncharacterized protein n=1 Tax=Xylaria flabelliformis TaxID=2512241 RepID=A0A553HQW9_9PEZI|nr:hypothetical protein FHL15_008714 [Xylaria flabelliformis]
METINNMAVSAAKAVWGESNQSTQEPVSGRLGDTSKGEPYDAGNIEPTSANSGDAAPTSAPTSGTTASSTTNNAELDSNTTKDAKFAKETGTAAESNDTPDNPSTDLKAKSVPEDTSKGQGDTRSPEDPKTNPKSAPTDVNDADEEGVNEAQKLDGPGPKPIAEVAKENGGDAGNDSSASVNKENKGESKEEKETKEREEEEYENKGTGEKYVKTTGLQADGGDFDATKPGAGKEADRLMEEKGIHNPNEPSSAGDSGSPTSGKKSFGQKIKDKLHRH